MATISELKRDRRLPEGEMDEVIVRAARLQERARAPEKGVSVAELKEVGQDLDIDPRYVDEALAELERERAQAAEAAKRARARRRKALIAGAAAAAVLVLMAWAGAGGVRAAQGRAEVAGSALDTVLERQARLLPQLLALSGASAGELAPHQRRLSEARDRAERAAAAEAMSGALTGLLARLPPPGDPSQAQQRLSLQHELVGAQNRITVEQRRHAEAVAAWRAATRGPAARLAVLFHFASAPPKD
jgi:LemA protein